MAYSTESTGFKIDPNSPSNLDTDQLNQNFNPVTQTSNSKIDVVKSKESKDGEDDKNNWPLPMCSDSQRSAKQEKHTVTFKVEVENRGPDYKKLTSSKSAKDEEPSGSAPASKGRRSSNVNRAEFSNRYSTMANRGSQAPNRHSDSVASDSPDNNPDESTKGTGSGQGNNTKTIPAKLICNMPGNPSNSKSSRIPQMTFQNTCGCTYNWPCNCQTCRINRFCQNLVNCSIPHPKEGGQGQRQSQSQEDQQQSPSPRKSQQQPNDNDYASANSHDGTTEACYVIYLDDSFPQSWVPWHCGILEKIGWGEKENHNNDDGGGGRDSISTSQAGKDTENAMPDDTNVDGENESEENSETRNSLTPSK